MVTGTWVISVVLLAYGAAPAAAISGNPVRAVRSEHPTLREAFLRGCLGSRTFQDLGRRVAAAHGVVLVTEGSCGGQRGCLQHWMAVAGERRYLRVVIDSRRTHDELAAIIGHELQHALEVLADPDIRSGAGIYWRFRRSLAESRRSFETQDALDVEDRVRRELGKSLHADDSGGPRCADVFTVDGTN